MNAIQMVHSVVVVICDQLTDDELIALNLVAQLESSPHGRIFDFKKVSALFDGNHKMHDITRDALNEYFIKRMKV